MPSLKTASKKETIKCEVIRAIGVLATDDTLSQAKNRATARKRKLNTEGLTTTIYPAKKVLSEDGKRMIDGEPVYVELPVESARAHQKSGAVRAVI